MRTYGKFGRRKFCCRFIKTCIGGVHHHHHHKKHKCRSHTKQCSFVGPIYKQKVIERCSFVYINAHCRQNKCCSLKRKFVINNGHKNMC